MEEAGIWDRLRADLLAAPKRAGKLDLDAVIIEGMAVRAFGAGEATGPSSVDRRKPGTEHILTRPNESDGYFIEVRKRPALETRRR